MNPSFRPSRGKVYLVGAGPGDPGMLTLRGAQCLARADVVLYDYLVNPRILVHARQGAELICLGRHGHSRIWTQAEINAALVQRAQAGQVVVRLKGGDPAVFARGAQEAQVLADHGIPLEIVPGITAALAAGSCAGVPITHSELASSAALVTGQEQEDKGESSLDYQALGRFPGTLVFYMGVTTAPQWTSALMAAGKSPQTPAVIIRRCSWPDQQTFPCTLGEVADQLAPEKRIRPPVIVIVGEVARLASQLSWFEKRLLFGRRIVVTRPLDQAGALADPLTELGANVLVQPAIEISPPQDWAPVDAAIARLEEFHWLVFSSVNGVRALLDRLLKIGRDLRALAGVQLAAIGSGTADELARYHLRADMTPGEFRAEALATELAKEAAGKKFLLARASRGREVLAEQLRAAGGYVEQVVVYTSQDVTDPDPQIADLLRSGRIDWMTVTSSAIARSLGAMFGRDLEKARLVSISPITSAVLRELGYEPAAEARQYTMDGVVEAILGAEQQKR